MPKPKSKVERRKVIVERDEQFDGGDQCFIMWGTGDVERYASPAEVLRVVRARDKRAAIGRGVVVVTEIEWRDGLQPPEER